MSLATAALEGLLTTFAAGSAFLTLTSIFLDTGLAGFTGTTGADLVSSAFLLTNFDSGLACLTATFVADLGSSTFLLTNFDSGLGSLAAATVAGLGASALVPIVAATVALTAAPVADSTLAGFDAGCSIAFASTVLDLVK